MVDPSNLWLTIHESIGHATELDRALGYEAAYAGTSFATFDQLGKLAYGSPVMNVTGDRTAEHGLATIGYDDEGVEAQSWDLVKDGTLVGYQTGPADREADGPGPLQRLRVRRLARSTSPCSAWRTCRCSRIRAGSSTEDLIGGVERGIYVVGDRSWSIDMQRYNFQFTGQRFFRIENGRLAGPAAGRRLPGDDDGLLGLDGEGRRPADLCAGRRVQLRQGPAGPGRGRLARLPLRPLPRREHPQHDAGGRTMSRVSKPYEIVERALELSTADGCVVIADESSSANLRWAGNALTTNGVTRGRTLTVIATVDGAEGTASGVVSRSAVTADDLEPLVRAAEAAARGAGPAEDAQPLVTGVPASADFTEPPAETGSDVFADFAPALGDAFARARAGGRELYGFAHHELTLDVPGYVDGAAAAPRPAERDAGAERQVPRPDPLRLGGPGHPRLQGRRPGGAGRGAGAAPRLGGAAGSSCPPGATRRCCRRPRWPTC